MKQTDHNNDRGKKNCHVKKKKYVNSIILTIVANHIAAPSDDDSTTIKNIGY